MQRAGIRDGHKKSSVMGLVVFQGVMAEEINHLVRDKSALIMRPTSTPLGTLSGIIQYSEERGRQTDKSCGLSGCLREYHGKEME